MVQLTLIRNERWQDNSFVTFLFIWFTNSENVVLGTMLLSSWSCLRELFKSWYCQKHSNYYFCSVKCAFTTLIYESKNTVTNLRDLTLFWSHVFALDTFPSFFSLDQIGISLSLLLFLFYLDQEFKHSLALLILVNNNG